MVTPETVERYREDALYFAQQHPALLEQYPDAWVAVFDRQVVASAKELDNLLAELDRKGIPRGQVFIEYLSTKDDLYILNTR